MHKIKSITIFGSSVCNFNCSFCFLHKNKAYGEYNKLLCEAWDNGSYLINMKRSLEKLNVETKDVNEIQIWGGESIINIDKITKNLKDIYKLFPNISLWQLSTNFSVHLPKFIDFIKELDKLANFGTVFNLQFSIDGPPGEISEVGHDGWEYYEDNIKLLTDTFNNYKLNNITINMIIHSTLNKEHYLKLADYDYLKDYMIKMYEFGKSIKDRCISKSLYFNQDIIYPNLATPYEDTKEDGEKIAQIFYMWDKLYKDYFEKLGLRNNKFYSGMGLFANIKRLTAPNSECRELSEALSITHEGKIVECSGSFIDDFEPYLTELLETKEFDNYLTSKVHKNMSMYNPVDCSDKDIARKEWSIHVGGYRGNLTTYLQTTIKAANELAHSGQILDKYKDNFPLLHKHCSLMLNCSSCSRNNIAETRMPYVLPIGAIRRFLNGAIDYIYDDLYNNFERVEMARCIRK